MHTVRPIAFLSVTAAMLLGCMVFAGTEGGQTITLRAARMVDGRGTVVANAVIEIQGSKITAVDRRRGGVTHDLGDVTVLPGLIDVHTHITHRVGPDGKFPPLQDVTPEQRQAAYDANLKATLVAGFTTVQSLGTRQDKPLRDAIAAGTLLGPRILTSLAAVFGGPSESPRSVDQLRATVRQFKADGADVIKVVASGAFQNQGAPTMTQEQLDAVCDEARKLGLRTAVHAHGAEAIIRAAKARCTQVEHGVFATDEALTLMAEYGTYFVPNIGVALQTQLENKLRYREGSEPDFAAIEKALVIATEMFKRALKTGVKMPLGSDAEQWGHGQNAREIIARVQAGQAPVDALISGTSLAAESLGLGSTLGAIAPGFEADILAVGGNPLTDITRVRDVRFVMKGGAVISKTQ